MVRHTAMKTNTCSRYPDPTFFGGTKLSIKKFYIAACHSILTK